MKIFGLAGWSGSGKTSLITRLVPELTGRGLCVSTMKHAHHSFDMDKPGKVSYVHREADATEVMVSSASRWALLHENRETPEPSMEELIQYMTPVDLLLVEGFKTYPHDKIEVYRPANGKPLLTTDDGSVVAIATDAPDGLAVSVPILDLNDTGAIADFIVACCGLSEERTHGAA